MKLTHGSFEQLEFEEGCYVNAVLQENEDEFPLHWHAAAEIIIPTKGSYLVNVNNTPYKLNENDILFISIGELHEMPKQTPGTRMILQFDFSLISNLKDFNASLSILQSVKCITQETDPDIHPAIVSLISDIRYESETDNPFKNGLMYSKLLQIYVLIARKYMNMASLFPDTTPNKQREYTAKFSQIFTYINAHYTQELSLDELAFQAGFSKFHFSRLFKQFTNKTLYDYLNQKRISSAEVLLLNPNLSVTEVSLQAGFNSMSTFNRVFKAAKGCTPTEFKQLYISHQ